MSTLVKPHNMDVSLCSAVIKILALMSNLHYSQGVDVLSEVGEKAVLPCPVNPGDCGQVHSIKWYKDSHRIFVFSEAARVSRPEPGYEERFEVEYTRNKSSSSLVIQKAVAEDEGLYRCEITYVEVSDTCQAVHHLNFTTLIRPESIRAYLQGGEVVSNGTTLRELTEGEVVVLFCEAGPAKPTPSVHWTNGTYILTGDMEVEESGDTGTGRSRLELVVSRTDLGVKYECRAYHPSLGPSSYLHTTLRLDVGVRPKEVRLEGVDSRVLGGSRLELECLVQAARPPATIRWYNGTTLLEEASNGIKEVDRVPWTKKTPRADGTFDTVSRLSFTASRYDNDQTLRCEATNDVIKSKNEAPLTKNIHLQVLYPPIVTVGPEVITVNESAEVLMTCEYVANPPALKSVKWLRDDVEVDVTTDHYQGGNTGRTSLFIKNTSRFDMGNYTCILGNEVGEMPSYNSVYLSIHFKPETAVRLDPPSPVIASPDTKVRMSCEVEAGNPRVLTHVRWFLDGESIASLPNCSNSTFCGLNPSEVYLDGITTSFHGNWTCVGKNEAGWGPISPRTQLEVYYPPRGVKLKHSPELVVKRRSMTLYCSVEERGRPANTSFRWTRGGLPVPDISSANYTIQSVTLASETNFTCTAVNLGGESEPATHFIKVHAPPTFIKRLPPYFGALMTSQSISMTCRVECSPICSIMWLKNGHRFETGLHARYYIENTIIPPDTRTNDFESVQSTLVWNMTTWPGGRLDRISDNANYTCYSTGNAVGQGVKSSTFFGVEYPPENLTVSSKVVNVIEGNVPEKVLCRARAYPEASYQWRKEGDSEIIIKGNALILNHPILRKSGGNYVCEAYNRHGNNTQEAFINVLYKPECGIIKKKDIEGRVALECTAIANPEAVDFTWKIKNENETIDEHIEKNGLQSVLTLDARVENSRTYLCLANNSVGISVPCEVDVIAFLEKSSQFSAKGRVSWWGRLENESIIILLAVIISIIITGIIVWVVFVFCRRKRAADKYATVNKETKNASPNDVLLPHDSDSYENVPFHFMQSTPNKRIQNSQCERRSRPTRKPAHHSSAREVNSQPVKDDYHKYKTTPYNSQNGSPPRSGHYKSHRAHHNSPRNHAEYAFIKFQDIGQEIDV